MSVLPCSSSLYPWACICLKYVHIVHVAVPLYPWRNGSRTPTDNKVHECSNPLYKMGQCLHITYTHPPIYLKSFLGLLATIDTMLLLLLLLLSRTSCPTLCDPIDGSPPGSTIPGILQARTLKWIAISFSNAWKWKVKVESLSCVWLFVTPWAAAYQAPPSMGFSRQEYWSGLPLPSLIQC